MTVTYMELTTRNGAYRPGLFRKRTRDALADLMAQRFPFGRRGAVRKAFKLTDDQARAVCRASASWETFGQVIDAGGWELALELLAIRFGENVASHLAREAARHAERSEATAAMVRTLRSRAADGGDADPAGGAGTPARLGEVGGGTTHRSFRDRS